jgi:hypothetical protein
MTVSTHLTPPGVNSPADHAADEAGRAVHEVRVAVHGVGGGGDGGGVPRVALHVDAFAKANFETRRSLEQGLEPGRRLSQARAEIRLFPPFYRLEG